MFSLCILFACEAISIIAAGLAIVGAVMGGVAQYQQAEAQKAAGKAQQTAAEAQAREAERQAELEERRAGIAQIQGEQEAAKRSSQLAADIGSLYAGFAGNGLLVDGGTGTKDTVGSVLYTTTAEGQKDISTIRDNTAISVWEHQSNKNSLLATAGNTRIAGQNAYASAKAQASASKLNAYGSTIQGIGSGIAGGASLHNAIGGKTILGYNVPK